MKRKRRFRPPRFTTVVGKDTVIRGDVIFGGGLHLDGQVEGNVMAREEDTRATLTVSDEGRIKGDVHVANVILNGTVHGDVHATERVELAEQARVTGRVHYRMLEMAVEVNGELIRIEDADEASAPALPATGQAIKEDIGNLD